MERGMLRQYQLVWHGAVFHWSRCHAEAQKREGEAWGCHFTAKWSPLEKWLSSLARLDTYWSSGHSGDGFVSHLVFSLRQVFCWWLSVTNWLLWLWSPKLLQIIRNFGILVLSVAFAFTTKRVSVPVIAQFWLKWGMLWVRPFCSCVQIKLMFMPCRI